MSQRRRQDIHNCYNSIGTWFYQALGGIRPLEDVPSYKKIKIEPQIPKGITWAKVSKETPYGLINVYWETDGKVLDLQISIPHGIEAEIETPSGFKNRMENTYAHEEIADMPVIGHGKYKFTFETE